jgi:DNA-binding XRE family transcriptional regulator
MTQLELKNAVGISRQSIGFYERGKIPPPFQTLASIASALKADQFVVEDLRITFSRNGVKTRPEPTSQQLNLNFDRDGGVTMRIESVPAGLVVKALSA